MDHALDRRSGAPSAAKAWQHVADQRMIGKVGRVTGTIAPDRVGEVMVPVRGGTEHFHAYAADAEATIAAGRSIVVVEYYPPRSVVVSPL